MLRKTTLLVVAISAIGCASDHRVAIDQLALLTSPACSTSAEFREHLDHALTSMGATPTYQVVDLVSLPETDARRGYGTPTVLYRGRDIFGLPEPQPPYPDPT